MKKLIFAFAVLVSFSIEVKAKDFSNYELEKKYLEFATFVEQDVEFVKMTVKNIDTSLTELQILEQLMNEITYEPGNTDIYILYAATTSQKNNAANWAKSIAQKSRPYNEAFYANKSCKTSDNYNCSQLVWCAYKETANIDLDSDLGFGVYPSDLIKGSKVAYVTTY